MNEKWEQSKTLKKADGTVAVIWEGRLHNWDGPAYIPQGNKRKAEYHIYGINIVKKNGMKEKNKEQAYHTIRINL